ncbi:cytochrome P450 3A4 [Pyrenophora tritici-repentis]|nr:cytochrome P450 3A4 [Pyrenophora tritici-repentis]KAI0612284.1 cytochrome P450 3A4 [Pyrenophora tritici-repentis]KAI0625270.1 cytochrome P450 3A4 [Pyrenophora tritici-repentis]KAI1525739.1 CypX Cytochrome P450 [Pyrenophora tritici-repentis]KAI1561857.1 CypX Cytochrome P450 [Pyrenophora tritici-repentis]
MSPDQYGLQSEHAIMSSLHEQLTRSELFSLRGFALASGLTLAAAITYSTYIVIYNLFFHPLRHIPGPLFARACPIPYALVIRKGTIIPWLKALHDKYGEVVRMSPGQVSFISGETAWQDVQGFRTGKSKDSSLFMRDTNWAPASLNGTTSIFASNGELHARLRRNVASGFSVSALRLQESLILEYADLLVSRLREVSTEGAVDMVDWYSFTAFDIIGDLIFSEPFGCLRDGKGHEWVPFVYNGVSNLPKLYTEKVWAIFKWYDTLRSIFEDQEKPLRTRLALLAKSQKKVNECIAKVEKGTDKRVEASFFAGVIRKEGTERGLTRNELDTVAMGFLGAGSETTATILSGATYMLLINPDKYEKIVHEIRTAFSSTEEITMDAVNKLEYLIAVFQESFRMYPPVSTGIPRVAPPSGAEVSGYYVPGGTNVHIPQHAANLSTRNFKDPEKFVPERWLGDPKYKDDKLSVMQPFGMGPTVCLGKNLAYVEMRVILAKCLFAFDMELDESVKSEHWINKQRQFFLWEKPDLNVRLTPVKR